MFLWARTIPTWSFGKKLQNLIKNSSHFAQKILREWVSSVAAVADVVAAAAGVVCIGVGVGVVVLAVIFKSAFFRVALKLGKAES